MNSEQRDRAEALKAARAALTAPTALSLSAGKKPATGVPLSDLLVLSQWILRGDEVLDEWDIPK